MSWQMADISESQADFRVLILPDTVATRQLPTIVMKHKFSTIRSEQPILAILFQAIDPPIINGVRKPRKPGGT